jgi:cytochrome c peroxidase
MLRLNASRGEHESMSLREKKGALTFFGKGQCVACHTISRKSNEMFSDFEMHVMGVPQIAPEFGIQKGT